MVRNYFATEDEELRREHFNELWKFYIERMENSDRGDDNG